MPNDYRFFQEKISGKEKEIYDVIPVINSVGDLTMISGIDVIVNSIRNLLLTPLGFYPFDPEYGSLLYQKLFEMSDEQTQSEIVYEVRERVKRYDPRVIIDSVDFSYSSDKKTAVVNVHINRNGIPGKVSAVLTAQKSMFGLEDSLTASWDK